MNYVYVIRDAETGEYMQKQLLKSGDIQIVYGEFFHAFQFTNDADAQMHLVQEQASGHTAVLEQVDLC